ncbi:sulfur carrier protein ThiS [bacterium]|nr:sulfur carrier protein ThiS [Candidatus Omnitrophota bacterium]MBU3929323.1 sulfur carrier protein ThiS [bacterium]MBU4122700.1 sulfur carrier protein ThiS [bacterium]
MRIKVNGKTNEIEKSLTVAELLVLNEVEMPDMVSVQLNGNFINRENFSTTAIKENDEIDFLYFMGGGR